MRARADWVIVSVQVVDGFLVHLVFEDGFERTIDLEQYLFGPVFKRVRNDSEYFKRIRVDPESGTIVWPNGADLAPDTLYLGVPSARMESEAPDVHTDPDPDDEPRS